MDSPNRLTADKRTVFSILLSMAAVLLLANSFEVLRTKRLFLEPTPPKIIMSLLCVEEGHITADLRSSEISHDGDNAFKIWNDELKRDIVYVKAEIETCMILPVKDADAAEKQKEERARPRSTPTQEPVSVGIRKESSGQFVEAEGKVPVREHQDNVLSARD